jgi:hypothetical protein
MVPDKFERYAVSYGPEGLHIRMRQALHCVGCGVLALGMLAACLVGALDVGWAGTGFCAVLVAFVAMCAAWTEDWIITFGEIRYRNSFHIKERCVRRSGGRSPCVWRSSLPIRTGTHHNSPTSST